MKNFFYGILSFILTLFLVTYVVFLFTNKKYYEFPEEQTGVIVHKEISTFKEQNVFVLHNDSTIGAFNCYDILFEQIEVGDSIINGKIKSNE